MSGVDSMATVSVSVSSNTMGFFGRLRLRMEFRRSPNLHDMYSQNSGNRLEKSCQFLGKSFDGGSSLRSATMLAIGAECMDALRDMNGRFLSKKDTLVDNMVLLAACERVSLVLEKSGHHPSGRKHEAFGANGLLANTMESHWVKVREMGIKVMYAGTPEQRMKAMKILYHGHYLENQSDTVQLSEGSLRILTAMYDNAMDEKRANTQQDREALLRLIKEDTAE